jgi:hypothetical protein
MPDLGVRLQLLIGPTVPTPAPYDVVDALVELEVRNDDRERDGFQMTFNLGRRGTAQDYSLLQSGILDPPNRVIIMVIIGVLPQVLIDGMITNHQVVPSNEPGQSRLVVTGEDISLQLDLEEKSATYPNQRDSDIVTRIIAGYATYGLVPDITQTSESPPETERITTQQGTDLIFIQQLAARNSFVFYIEPTDVPTVNTAYWGQENRRGQRQPALTMNMGSDTNVDQLTFGFNALGPVTPQVTITEPLTKMTIPIPVPDLSQPSLTSRPARPLRTTVRRDTANLNLIQAALRALVAASEGADAATARGVLDAVRYGRALRPRRLVDLRGAGQTHDGTYYVKQVTHRIKRGEYKQNFTLTREGRGASSPTVVT